MSKFQKLYESVMETNTKDFEEVYKDQEYVVEKPLTYEWVNKKYGKNTRWDNASSSQGEYYFNMYNDKGDLYILRKKDSDKPEAQFFIKKGKVEEVYDPSSRVYDYKKVFGDNPKLEAFFKKIINKT